MKKPTLNPEINETFTHYGKEYITLPAMGIECNPCKGCDFAELSDLKHKYPLCIAPQKLYCCRPNRIFKLIPKDTKKHHEN